MGILRTLVLSLLLLAFALSAGTAWAQSTDSATTKNPFEKIRENLLQKREVIKDKRATATAKREEFKEKVAAKRDEQKVKRCEVKEKVITNRVNSLTRLVSNIEEKFTAIVERVKKHYTEKVLPSGKTVENYDALLADIDTKKAAVDSALASAKTNADGFTCDSDDPKAQMTLFRTDMQTVKDALNAYKKSIRNLIVAVKSVTGGERSEKKSNE